MSHSLLYPQSACSRMYSLNELLLAQPCEAAVYPHFTDSKVKPPKALSHLTQLVPGLPTPESGSLILPPVKILQELQRHGREGIK